MGSRSLGDDLWIQVSDPYICQPEPAFCTTNRQHDPFFFCKVKKLASLKSSPIDTCSCVEQIVPDIPKVGLFDEYYVQPEAPEIKQRRCWGIHRTSSISTDDPGTPRRCKGRRHWGRNIIESKQMLRHTTCVIM